MAAHFISCRAAEALLTCASADISMGGRRLAFSEPPTGPIRNVQQFFDRVQIAGGASALAKYCQQQKPN